MPEGNPMNWVEINARALHANAQFLARQAGCPLIVVVKSNAYGHGAELIASELSKRNDVAFLGVANAKEAIQLRDFGITKPILVLSYYDLHDLKELAGTQTHIVVYSEKQLRAIKKIRHRFSVHLKVDTGTSRVGVLPQDVETFLKKFPRNAQLAGVFSHFSSSEEDDRITKKQIALFSQTITTITQRQAIPWIHLSCSASVMKRFHVPQNVVRVGIGLYGLNPLKVARTSHKSSLKPVLSWKTRLVQVKNIPKGAAIGYNRTVTVKRPTRLGVIAAGYFEGIPRALGNNADVLVRGGRAPILGNICMNISMIDVTSIPGVREGDTITLIGRSGRKKISADELAKNAGTIHYELVTRINPLLARFINNTL